MIETVLVLGLMVVIVLVFNGPAMFKRRSPGEKITIPLSPILVAVFFRKTADGALEPSPFAKWFKAHRTFAMALFWGGFMYIAMTLVPTLVDYVHGKAFDGPRLLYGAVIWALGGLAFGALMSVSLRRLEKKAKAKEDPSIHF